MKMAADFKKTKGNPPIYGGRFGRIFFSIYANRNKNNTRYFKIGFSMPKGNNLWNSLPVSGSDLANLQQALDAARLWLRKNG